MHQSRAFRRPSSDILGYRLMQGDEAVEATVNVADGIDALSGRQGGGGGSEFNHGCPP
jgi:hypothetical protein